MNSGLNADGAEARAVVLPKIAIDRPSLPSGEGSMAGLGATFSADHFTGSLTGTVTVGLPSARGLEPVVELKYDAGIGNGLFGLGFDLAIPRIAVRAETVPRYDGHERFMLSGRLLERDKAASIRRHVDGVDYEIARYRPVIETDFATVEQWTRRSDGDVHWRIVERNANVSLFGTRPQTRISDPADQQCVYSWLLEETSDPKGNRIVYEYRSEDAVGIPSTPENAGRDRAANRYIDAIRYGNYQDADGATAWMFGVLFDYGDYDLTPDNPDPARPTRPWTVRPDPFSTYRPGFELRTWRRCNGILVTHCFPAELGKDPILTRSLRLDYDPDHPVSRIISVTETGWRRYGAGAATTLRKVPLKLTWTTAPIRSREFLPLEIAASGRFGAEIANDPPRLVDLDGDGLPGLLISTPSELLYWRNAGNGRFTGPVAPRRLPNLRDFGADGLRLSSIDRFGRLDAVVETPGIAGYFPNRGATGFADFKAFDSRALQALDPGSERISLSGNEHGDVLTVGDGTLTWTLARGTLGYGPTRIVGNLSHLPKPGSASSSQFVGVADMFGDGLDHVVEIGTGRVRVWPNLGYGRFSAPVEIANPPFFPDGVPADRIYLVDTQGSGTADIVVVHARHLAIHRNESGNTFAPPIWVTLPAPFETIDAITFGDVLADGTCAAIVSLAVGEQRHFYYDFTDGKRLSLLAGVDNGRGAITSVSWRASTTYQIADARAGQPWITTSPFPVQVIDTIRREDLIAGSTKTSRFAYHDAFYDPIPSSFRGFAAVEVWDAESLSAGAENADHDAVIPTYQKHWFLNGAYEEWPLLQASWQKAFYRGDSSCLELAPARLQLGQDAASGRVQRQAWSALAGAKVRTETYGLDGSDAAVVPYSVSQNTSTITLLQPPGDTGFGVYFLAVNQSAETHYERNPEDPRTTEDFVLERNAIGLPLVQANIAYPRLATAHITPLPQQLVLRASTTVTTYATPVDGSAIVGLPSQETAYELSGLTPALDGSFSADALLAQIEVALLAPLLPEQPFSGTAPQARYQTVNRIQYLGSNGLPLPLGQLTSPALAWRTFTAAFTPGMIAANFGARLTDAMIDACGYQLDSGFWWQPSNAAHYGTPAQFYQLLRSDDPFGNQTTSTYDSYSLMVVAITDALGATMHATPDYQALAPAAVVSINGITQQALYDPLGELLARSTFGTIDGKPQGDGDLAAYVVHEPPSLGDVVENADLYLQMATEYFYRDPQGFAASHGPSASIHLARQTHLNDADQSLPITKTVVYFDGERRTLQTKSLIEGAAVGAAADRWVASGRMVYDAKGRPVRVYLPAVTDSFDYTPEFGALFDSTSYDALGRQIATLSAKGFTTATHYAAWSETAYDSDDTVKTSPYYIANINNLDPAFALQRAALLQAAVFENTPRTEQFDPRRVVIQVDQRLNSSVDPAIQILSSVLTVDGLGRTVAHADARFSQWNDGHTDKRFNVLTSYDMGKTALVEVSCDAGTMRQFMAADGLQVYRWTAADLKVTRSYDALRRPSVVRVDGGGLAQIVEIYSYGLDAGSNLNGRLIEHKDQAGILTFPAYDIDGVATTAARQVRVDIDGEVNWNADNTPPLDPPITITSSYAIDGRILTETGPDGSVARFGYYRSGWVATQSLTLPAGITVDTVATVSYNARGQRQTATFGNGTIGSWGFEETTGRMISATTTRSIDNKRLQDIAYVYDPAGNITEIVDNSVNDIVSGHDLVDPGCSFTCDSLYRLIESTGRQSPTIGPDTYHTGFMGTAFVPDQTSHANDTAKLIRYREIYTYDHSDNPLTLQHLTDGGAANFSRAYIVSETSNHAIEATASQTDLLPDAFYDAGGNMISLPYVRALQWSYRNTLSAATAIARSGAGDDRQIYCYDADGVRVAKVTDRLVNVTTGSIDRTRSVTFGHYRLDQRETITRDGDSTVTERSLTVMLALQGDLQLTVRSFDSSVDPHGPAPQWRYQYATNLASIDLELDQAGQVVSYEEYFAYGGSAFIAGPSQIAVSGKIFRYCAKECDDITGLYYYGARYYVPWMGRWLSADPLGTADGLNLYCYAGANPVSYADPDGTTKKPVDQGDSGAAKNTAPQPRPLTGIYATIWNGIRDNPGKSMIGSAGVGVYNFWNLLGVKFVGHVTAPMNYAKIIADGLSPAGAGTGNTPPGKGTLIEGQAKSFNDAAALNARGRVFIARFWATVVYANQGAIKSASLKTNPTMDPRLAIKPYGTFSYLYQLNPLVSFRNTIVMLLPPQVLANFHPDPDSILKILDNRKTGLTLFSHFYDQQGYRASMPNTIQLAAYRSDVGVGVAPRYVVGGPKFDLFAVIKEALAASPEAFGTKPFAAVMRTNVVMMSVFVAMMSGAKFVSDNSK